MTSSLSYEFILEDSSSSDDSDIDEPLTEDDTEHMVVILTV
jgi:hypothetical protein